uniref:Uncharacterized protein n=2 Tax=Aegilops tauschii subsp. strangulata TaxID=200361 RepID=A0A453KU79_AEGTS
EKTAKRNRIEHEKTMAAAAGDEPETTVEVKLRAVGPSRPTNIRLPPLISVGNAPGAPSSFLPCSALINWGSVSL